VFIADFDQLLMNKQMIYINNATFLQQPKLIIQVFFVIFTIVVIVCFGEIDWLVIKISVLGLIVKQIG
jgi:hypothetical protein